MSRIDKFRGAGVALVTPFDKSARVDFGSLEKIVNHVIRGGIDYVVALGTTGETPVLNHDEKNAIVRFIVDVVNKRVPVVVGIGGYNTQEIINTVRHFDFNGIDSVLSVSPSYNKPNQRGIYEHYKAIARVCPLPVILYNVPGRTSSNITAETTLKLANEIKNIIGIKEASGNIDQIMQIIKHRPKDFLVISGDDLMALPIIASGGDGVISVIANAFPREFSGMAREALAGNYYKARKLHYVLDDFTRLIFADGNPAGVKYLLSLMKIAQPYVRLPLVQINREVQGALKKEYAGYEK
jgi:4-hydroxy-tetrahydrodipicolinate synthase